MPTLPFLERIFCPFCDKWLVNKALDEGVFEWHHDGSKEHPADMMKYQSKTEYWQ